MVCSFFGLFGLLDFFSLNLMLRQEYKYIHQIVCQFENIESQYSAS